MNNYKDRRFLSFFSGALGLDLGLESAGLYHLAANEVEPVICETIRLNKPKLRLYNFDIRQLTPERLMADLAIDRGELFLVCGGPPCQAFSTAGKRLGLNDDRGNVFLHFIDLIGGLQPKYVIIENVRGLLSAPLVHRPHSERGFGYAPLFPDEQPGGALRRIVELLKNYGYEVSFNLYNTANFGVPQVRERLVMFASRDGMVLPYLVPTHDNYGRFGLSQWRTFRDAVSGLEAPHEYLMFPERRLRFLRMIGPGQNWRDLPEALQPEALGKAFYADGGRVGFYRRLAWDKPSPTVVTCPTMPATDLAHPVEDRPLSVQEYMRIQTFPDSWRLAGKTASKYKQIGNAVPVEFGAAIGRHLLAFDAGTLADVVYNVPLSRYRNTDHVSWLAAVYKNESNAQIMMAER